MPDNPFAQFATQATAGQADNPFAKYGSSTPDVVMPHDGKPARITVRPASVPEALGRGMAQGLTANFYDELSGLAAAGGRKSNDEPLTIGHILTGAYKKFTDDPEATKQYADAVAAERQRSGEVEASQPVASTIGNIGGSLMLPMGAAASGATLPARIGRGAMVGAGVGAASGFGAGEGLPNSAAQGAVGGILGAGVGAVAAPLVEGAIQGGKYLSRPIVNAVRGAVNPDAEASRIAAESIGRGIQADPNAASRLTPQEFLGSSQNGGPATLMDMGGDITRRVADAAGIASPEGGTVLKEAVNNRFEGQAGRVTDWLNNTFNFPNATAQQVAIDQVQKTVNDAGYRRAMLDGASGVWDKELQRLAGAPAIQQASEQAVPSLANRGIAEGFRAPRQNPLTFDNETGLASLSTLPNGNKTVPDLRFWDQVKRNLDGMIGTADRAGDNARVAELTGLKRELVNKLDTMVPSYAKARAGAAHFFGAENALEAGQNFVTAKLGNDEARAQLAKMTPTERQLFQDGFVSRFMQTLNETADRRSILNKIAESPAARERLNMVLGPQRAAELEGGLRVEGIMDMARTAITGNSWTARRLVDLGLMTGGSGIVGGGGYNMDPKEMAFGAVVAAIGAGGKKVDARVMQRVAQLLVSKDPRQLQLGITLLGRNEKMLDNLRAVDRRIASSGGQQAARVPMPALQGAVPAGASSEQPQPQGVINQ